MSSNLEEVFIATNRDEADQLSVNFFKGFPHPPFAHGQRRLTTATGQEISKQLQEVYDGWSYFSKLLASHGADSHRTRTALKAALILSHKLTVMLFRFKNASYLPEFCKWVESNRLPIAIQPCGESIPWNLLYCSVDAPSENLDDLEIEYVHLLGIRSHIFFQVVIDGKEAIEEVRSTPEKILVTVGDNLPGYRSFTEAVRQVEGVVRDAFPGAKQVRRITMPDHERQFVEGLCNHDLWFVATHGESVGKYSQNAIKLKAAGEKTSSDQLLLSGRELKKFRNQRPTENIFSNSACALLLACRSGILSSGWDLPETILEMGAGSVIAPQADVSLAFSLELSRRFFAELASSPSLPSWAFAKAQRSIVNMMERCHANLFTTMVTDHEGIQTESKMYA